MSEKKESLMKNAAEAAKNAAGRISDFWYEFSETNRSDAYRNYIDLEDAIANGLDYRSPEDSERAADGISEESRKAEGPGRDLERNAARSRKKRESGEKILSDSDRDAKIDQYLEMIEKEMDRRGCDGLLINCAGYKNIRIVRVPEENAPVQMNLNGKPVYVHPDLVGSEVFVRGSQAEVSRDLLESLSSMISGGTMRAEKELDSGSRVTCSADIRVNGRKAVVDPNIGENECVEEPGGRKISRGLWDEAYEKIESNEFRVPMWAATKEDLTFECGIEVRVNGKPASIDNEVMKGTVRKGSDTAISRDDWDLAYKEMMASGSKMYGKTLSDGSVITCRLNMRVNGEPAEIDSTLEGITTVKKEPAVKVGKGIWEKAKEEITASPNPSRASYQTYDQEGRKIDCRIQLKVDGMEAAVNTPFKEGTVKEGREGVEISRDIYEKALSEMDKDLKTVHGEKLDDGREISFKRKAKPIKIYTQSGEITDEEAGTTRVRDAVAEMGRVDEAEKRKKMGAVASIADREMRIQFFRSVPSMPIRGFEKWGMMRERDRSLFTQILGMAAREMSQAGQTIAR